MEAIAAYDGSVGSRLGAARRAQRRRTAFDRLELLVSSRRDLRPLALVLVEGGRISVGRCVVDGAAMSVRYIAATWPHLRVYFEIGAFVTAQQALTRANAIIRDADRQRGVLVPAPLDTVAGASLVSVGMRIQGGMAQVQQACGVMSWTALVV